MKPRFIILLDITKSDSNQEIIQRLKELFKFLSILKTETWVIGSNLNPNDDQLNQTKSTIELILENESYDSIKFFLIENMVCF
jgi:hypothetical protein